MALDRCDIAHMFDDNVEYRYYIRNHEDWCFDYDDIMTLRCFPDLEDEEDEELAEEFLGGIKKMCRKNSQRDERGSFIVNSDKFSDYLESFSEIEDDEDESWSTEKVYSKEDVWNILSEVSEKIRIRSYELEDEDGTTRSVIGWTDVVKIMQDIINNLNL